VDLEWAHEGDLDHAGVLTVSRQPNGRAIAPDCVTETVVKIGLGRADWRPAGFGRT